MNKIVVRRRHWKTWYFITGIFVMVFLFTFLAVKANQSNENVDAASLDSFDPGYIISDWQMGNYSSMTETEIQNFLWSKGKCYNTNFSGVGTRVDYFSDSTPPTTWHVSNGHTVCLAEENMNGETAAHIIWQAAQDYRINPQALIVLLQKETGIITDPIPNSWDYQRVAGYGCPDTAACSSKYYGFKNQIRNAAALFRAVLDGGWTNYPLGNNYIQYNPNEDCGGSWVNIRSLATSALYRYTPYQPNSGALAAGYGTAYCGAYGNRNFYLYFQDWFGDTTATQRSLKIAEGEYYLVMHKNVAMALDVQKAEVTNGANVQIYDKNGTEAQKWSITYNSTTDDYNIINVNSGKALDVSGASVNDGANVQIWEANSTCAQRWRIVETRAGGLSLLSACSYKALSLKDASVKNGVNIEISVNKENSQQVWDLAPANDFESGTYVIKSSINQSRVIDISGGVYNSKNGTNVQLWNKNATAAQQWSIKKTADGYFVIKNLQSGKALDVAEAKKDNGTNIQMWDDNGTCAQKWSILKSKYGYEFISACSYKALDLKAADSSPGSNIQIYDANNSKAQQWQLEKVELLEEGSYMIESRVGKDKAIDISGNKKVNGTNIQIYEVNGTTAQIWEIKYDVNDGYYTVYNPGAQKSLDVAAAGKSNGTNVQIWDDNATCAQKWFISKNGKDYTFGSACSDLVLDVEAARADNGTNVQLYEANGTAAQKWLLVPTTKE
ncbi:RICIN domain-containing protein [Candidatus Saccharibacteria bacterium]|nr:RICIN domain-containing protein [Candidatus Saccharibacteria bacterium]